MPVLIFWYVLAGVFIPLGSKHAKQYRQVMMHSKSEERMVLRHRVNGHADLSFCHVTPPHNLLSPPCPLFPPPLPHFLPSCEDNEPAITSKEGLPPPLPITSPSPRLLSPSLPFLSLFPPHYSPPPGSFPQEVLDGALDTPLPRLT